MFVQHRFEFSNAFIGATHGVQEVVLEIIKVTVTVTWPLLYFQRFRVQLKLQLRLHGLSYTCAQQVQEVV